MNNKNWIESKTPPKPNTQCKAKTPNGIDENGDAWYDGNKWWYWPKNSDAKFGMKGGYITHYIPLYERT